MSEPIRVGVDLSILRHPHSGSARWALGLHRALREHAADLELHGWIGPGRWRRGGPIRKVANLLRDRYWYGIQVPRMARRIQADVMLMPVNLSARRGPIPQVVSILDVNFLTVPGTYDPAYVAYARRAFARSARDAAILTTISHFSRSQIEQHLPVDDRPIRVVYPGLASVPSLRMTAPPLSRPYALFVGATEPHKNVGVLIDAWRSASPGGLSLAIVGRPGRDHDRLRRLVAELKDRATLVGAVGPTELEAWYRGASVFVFPSRAEGFGYPPLEAMQRAIPVVAARATALPEVLGEAALLHDPDDADEIGRQVESLVAEPALRQAQVARGMEQVKRYTWRAAGFAMGDLLRQAAGR